MSHEDRERKFEQALQRHLRRDATGARNEADAQAAPDEAVGAVECLDAATLAAFHEGTLAGSEIVAVKEHVAACSRCQEILMQMEATDEIPLPVEAENDLKMRESVLSTGALYVDYAARQTPSLTVAGQPTPASKAPHNISTGRGFKALRWAAPAGTIAAGLLIWIVVRDNKVQNTHFENVQVAQQQSTEERPATPRALPASPAPEVITKNKDLNERRKGESRAKQPAKESGALRARQNTSPAAITDEVAGVASEASPHANVRQLPSNSRDYISQSQLGAGEKPPEISSRQADVSATATAAAPAPAPPSGKPRVQSAAPVNEAAKADAKESANATETFEPHSNGNGGIELLQTQQMVVDDKLEPPAALKKVGLENPKIILASNTTVRWRLLSAGRIEQSVDSGITWVPQNSGVKVELLAGSAPSESVCWIVGRSGSILRTTDGGGHWNKVVSPMRGDVAGVQAADAMTAEIFDANKSSRFVTHDGGVTWQAAKE
jgi:hypothetical protein